MDNNENKKHKKEAPALVRVLIGELIYGILILIIWLILGMKSFSSHVIVWLIIIGIFIGALSYKV